MMRGEHKVNASHLQRAAIVYVRQSTLVQVREHTESTARQYGLVDQAARLGWPASGIEVIDQDLGLSGRTAAHRDGFKQLMGRVCLGEVGAIFGLEVSRLRAPRRTWLGCWSWPGSPTPWSSTPTASTTWPTSTTGCCWVSRAR
jgi:hypothetical protein